MTTYDPLIHPALLDPRQWADVNLYQLTPPVEREPVQGGAHHTRDRQFAMKHLRLELTFDDERESIAGSATLEIAPLADGFETIELDAAEMNITSVTRAGSPLEFETEKERLTIDLDRAFARGEELTIAIAYSCRPRKGVFFVKPDEAYPKKPRQIWSQGENEDAHWWFPCVDTTNQKMTTELIATVRDEFVAISNGSLVSVSENAEARTRTYHWRQDQLHPAYLVSIVAGRYERIAAESSSVPVEYYVYSEQREAATKLFSKTPEMIALFESRFGHQYPYPKYAQTLVDDFLFGAMENTSATTMTDRVLLDEKAAIDINYDDIVAHELAHQWWGDLVTCRDWSDIWLNESFATYAEFLWREAADGSDEARFSLFQDSLVYMNEDRKSHRRPIVSHQYRYSEELMDRHAYEKGACVLHMLRGTLGDDGFFRSMARYLEKHAFGVAETADFRIAIEEATGRNLFWFFDQWLFGAGFPELEVAYEWQREVKQLKVTVKQVQKREDCTPVFRLPVEIEIVTTSGRESRKHNRISYHVVIEKEEQEFHFPCETRPRLVIFDKGHRLLKLLRFQKSTQELIFQLKHDDDMLGRVRAARELGSFALDAVVNELRAVIEGADFWGVRLAAAISLGEIGSDEARTALVESLEQCREPRVRRGVLCALGNFKNADVVGLLGGMIETEASYFSVIGAVRALANIGSDEAYAILSRALTRPSWQEVIRAAVFQGLGVAKDKRAVDLAMAHTRYGEHIAVRVAAIGCLGALGKELRPDGGDERVVDHLLALLNDKSIRARVTAIRALCRVGNKRALGPLREAARRECLDQLKAAIDDAIETLEKPKKTSGDAGRTPELSG